jgi:hypothetical protein
LSIPTFLGHVGGRVSRPCVEGWDAGSPVEHTHPLPAPVMAWRCIVAALLPVPGEGGGPGGWGPALACHPSAPRAAVFPVQDCVATHDQQMLKATPCERLSELGAVWREYDVVGIDEGQFFPDLVEFSEMAANAGKIVLIAALDSTFQRMVRARMRGQVCVCVCVVAA